MEADERAKEKQQILHGLRRAVALTPASAVLCLSLLVGIDLAGTIPAGTFALSLTLLVTFAGPALVPFVSASGREALELPASIDLALDEWSRRGALSWLAHGLALGALLAAPAVLLVVPGLCGARRRSSSGRRSASSRRSHASRTAHVSCGRTKKVGTTCRSRARARARTTARSIVCARLDLGGALPVAATFVAVALAALAWAVMQRDRRGARAVALLAALIAYAAIAWAY